MSGQPGDGKRARLSSTAAASRPPIEVRVLSLHEEFAQAVRLQREIWGFEDVELLPQRLFVVADRIGGEVLGAFSGERMIGFCLCIPGLKPGGKYYLHSHMLGVVPEFRDAGVGRMLKLQQRTGASARGIDLIEWTFDPLELKNAYFNIVRLGAIVRRFVPNQYGTTSSRLHSGLPTDRLTAEWWINLPHVEAAVGGSPVTPDRVEAQIVVPNAIGRLRTSDPAEARSIQERIASAFEQHFRRGLAVVGFARSNTEGTYLLAPWPST